MKRVLCLFVVFAIGLGALAPPAIASHRPTPAFFFPTFPRDLEAKVAHFIAQLLAAECAVGVVQLCKVPMAAPTPTTADVAPVATTTTTTTTAPPTTTTTGPTTTTTTTPATTVPPNTVPPSTVVVTVPVRITVPVMTVPTSLCQPVQVSAGVIQCQQTATATAS